MNATVSSKLIFVNVAGLLAAGTMFAAEPTTPTLLQSDSGRVTFESVTNMPGIEVKGRSAALTAHVEIVRDSSKLVLHHMDASVAVKTLATGMKVRDEHMRKYIFTTADGQEPDLRFAGDEGTCEKGSAGREFVCRISGALSVRGVAKPLTLTLHAKEEGTSSEMFRASGDMVVKLSTYGIPAPSQFGVKPADEVKIHVDFTAKAKPVNTAGVVR